MGRSLRPFSANLQSGGEGLARRLAESRMVERVVDLVRPLAETDSKRSQRPTRLPFRIDALGDLASVPRELRVAGQRVHKSGVGGAEEALAHRPESRSAARSCSSWYSRNVPAAFRSRRSQTLVRRRRRWPPVAAHGDARIRGAQACTIDRWAGRTSGTRPAAVARRRRSRTSPMAAPDCARYLSRG